MNELWYGDCLTVLGQHINAYSIDLAYLDPPFNSNREYNAIYKDETGRPLPDQIEAFNDTWTLDEERERAIRNMPILLREAGISDEVAEFWRFWVNSLRGTNPRMLAYLSYMVERLVRLKTVMKLTGSVYVHCDPTANHYLKIMMDGIFGHSNFRDEIVWQRAAGRGKGSQHPPRTFGRDCDYILHYSITDRYTHNGIYVPLSKEEMHAKFPNIDEQGRRYNTDVPIFCGPSMGNRPNLCYTYNGITNPHPSGWRVKRERLTQMDANGEIIWREGKQPLRKSFASNYRGRKIGSLWTDIPNETGTRRLGYDTQKPVPLVERIISASSPPGGTVLDPFAGCGTTMEAAHNLGRKWIGIDIAIHAIKRVTKIRLVDRLKLKEGKDFIVRGVPQNWEGAKDLWEYDSYHFQKWAVEQVDGFVTSKKSADGGIDGRIYFPVWGEKDLQSMVIEVKGGKHVGIGVLRELRGVLEDDHALMAGLIVLNPPSERQSVSFRRFMADAGVFEVLGVEYQRMQILTVSDILEGTRFNTPSRAARGSSQYDLF